MEHSLNSAYTGLMPTAEEATRGGATKYRTIRVGTGKNKRILRVAIVRKSGARGGRTVTKSPTEH